MLLLILILLFFGGGGWGYHTWGFYGGGLGIIPLLLIIWLLLGSE